MTRVNDFQDAYERTDAFDIQDDSYVDLIYTRSDNKATIEEQQMSYTKRQLESTLESLDEYMKAGYRLDEISKIMKMDERIVQGLVNQYFDGTPYNNYE